jgi:hypothetical protein
MFFLRAISSISLHRHVVCWWWWSLGQDKPKTGTVLWVRWEIYMENCTSDSQRFERTTLAQHHPPGFEMRQYLFCRWRGQNRRYEYL